jgi:hypothetical protein
MRVLLHFPDEIFMSALRLRDGFLQRRFADGACDEIISRFAAASFPTLSNLSLAMAIRLSRQRRASVRTPDGATIKTPRS